MLSLTACGPDEPETDNERQQENIGGNIDSGNSTDDKHKQIQKIINDNVSVTSSYYDYGWHFEIHSTVHKAITNKEITLWIGHGDIDGETQMTGREYPSDYGSFWYYFYWYEQTRGNEYVYTIGVPFWFYYLYGIDPADDDYWDDCAVSWRVFNALTTKSSQEHLTVEEQNLFREVKDILNENEREVKYKYNLSIWIEIDGHHYPIWKR